MKKYFRGFTPTFSDDSQQNTNRPAEPPILSQNTQSNAMNQSSTDNTYNQGRPQDFNPQSEEYSLGRQQPSESSESDLEPPADNMPNSSANIPYYPTEEQRVDEFNSSPKNNISSDTAVQNQNSDMAQITNVTVPYTGMGSLSVQVFTADEALPIENVKITVTSDDELLKDIYEIRYTDSSGRTEPIQLPAPSIYLSQHPQVSARPYAVYNLDSEIEGYTANNAPINAVVFDQIQSIQNIPLIANRENM